MPDLGGAEINQVIELKKSSQYKAINYTDIRNKYPDNICLINY